MGNKNGKELQYKIAGIIIYCIFSLSGLSILLYFSPRSLLFNEKSEDDINKLFLFKNFITMIYENINKSFIYNISLTNENEECPEDFEILSIENQYHGHFMKFYGNRSFCIKRFNKTVLNFEKIITMHNNKECYVNQKACGRIFDNSDNPLCIPDSYECPLNKIDYGQYGIYKYPIINEKQAFIATYEPDKSVIVDMEIINNYKLCLGKHNIDKNPDCEFPENNQCFIKDNYDEIRPQEYPENLKFKPENIAKWNLPYFQEDEHKFCRNEISFHMFTVGYINFTLENYKEFKEEFPFYDKKNNSLFSIYELYKKEGKQFDIFFQLISFILLLWSFAHLVLQIFLYFVILNVRKIYYYNGIVLFIFKLISYFGMIINHYNYILKIKKVYLVLVDTPRNEVLEYYKSTRNIFLAKIMFFLIYGFIIILIDLAIFVFTIIFKRGMFIQKKEKEEEKEKEKEKEKVQYTNNIDNNKPLNENSQKKEENEDNLKATKKREHKTNPYILPVEIKNDEGSEEKIKNNNSNNTIDNTINNTNNANTKPSVKNEEINLQFVCKEDLAKSYYIKIQKNETFLKAIEMLKQNYTELKDKRMRVFSYESNIINKEQTISENGLSNNDKIIILTEL